ncbi:myo-inosose-2 dehydratase [Carnimonas nigrificans]|uniref:myo-inosose-2 dehydratase n=1 Tax=Carnimonas nigrificans TaxID=64323 RepID=UPI0004703441|nr:myo-inosose-2 dehydratase [Carnimonas nigrificans]
MSIRLGINPLSWTNDDLPTLGDETPLETCLRESREAGFEGVELGRKFPRTAEQLKPLLEVDDLALASGWYSSHLLEHSVEQELQLLEPHLRLLKAFNVTAMVFCDTSRCVHLDQQCPLSQRPRMSDEEWQGFCADLEVMARHLADHGIALAYHHHMGTVVQSGDDIDRLMENTSDQVGLLLDTGHCAFAGVSPQRVAEQWGARVRHLHCKNVRLPIVTESRNRDFSFLNAVLSGVFTVPGDGDLEFDEIFAALEKHHYSGWAICEAEQDPAVAPSLRYARKAHQFLTQQLQLTRSPA